MHDGCTSSYPFGNVTPAGVAAGHRDESEAGRRPLAVQHSVEKVVGPFTFRPGAFTQMTLAPHAQPFQHSSRGRISCAAASRDPVLAPPLKQVTEQAARRGPCARNGHDKTLVRRSGLSLEGLILRTGARPNRSATIASARPDGHTA